MGRLVRDGLHPDQHPQVSVGAWCDAVWSVYFELTLQFRAPEQMDAFGEVWDALEAPVVVEAPPEPVEPGQRPPRRRPTPEEMAAWGTSNRAQQGAANLASMMGGMPRAGGS